MDLLLRRASSGSGNVGKMNIKGDRKYRNGKSICMQKLVS